MLLAFCQPVLFYIVLGGDLLAFAPIAPFLYSDDRWMAALCVICSLYLFPKLAVGLCSCLAFSCNRGVAGFICLRLTRFGSATLADLPLAFVDGPTLAADYVLGSFLLVAALLTLLIGELFCPPLPALFLARDCWSWWTRRSWPAVKS